MIIVKFYLKKKKRCFSFEKRDFTRGSDYLNQGKMTSFVNILDLQKPFLDLSLKKASKWPRFNKSQKAIMKLILWTKISPKIHPSLINQKKKCTFMTYLRNKDFASRAPKSKFLIIKKNSHTFFQLAYVSQKAP